MPWGFKFKLSYRRYLNIDHATGYGERLDDHHMPDLLFNEVRNDYPPSVSGRCFGTKTILVIEQPSEARAR